jgi:predicted metal-dependent peptidase
VETNEARRYFSAACSDLLSSDRGRFYAYFAMKMNVMYSDRVPSAGVSITDKINFYINPTFFNGLEHTQRIELIAHEIEHIVKLHPIRAKELGENYNHETHHVYNLATDAEINEPLKALTKDFGITIQRLNELAEKEKSSVRFDKNDASDVNYWKLKELKQDLKDSGALDKYTTDDHSTWEESNANAELAKEIIKETTKKAVDNAGGIGKVPGHLTTALNELFTSEVNWKQQLRQFIGNAQYFNYTFSRKRRNRRYGLLVSGRKKNPKLKIAVCVDTSGSMSGEPLEQAWAELSAIYSSSSDLQMMVIEADCEIQNVYEFDKKSKPEFKGAGGTAYSPALKKAVELECDIIVYIGDMDSADTPEDPHVPVIWCITSNSNPPGKFGRTIHVKVK